MLQEIAQEKEENWQPDIVFVLMGLVIAAQFTATF